MKQYSLIHLTWIQSWHVYTKSYAKDYYQTNMRGCEKNYNQIVSSEIHFLSDIWKLEEKNVFEQQIIHG
jgi:hypothetical protein